MSDFSSTALLRCNVSRGDLHAKLFFGSPGGQIIIGCGHFGPGHFLLKA